MNMVIPNEGKLKWLYWALCTDGSDLENFSLRLMKTNVTIADATTLADLTVADFTGYANIAINRSTMGTPAITSNVAYSTRSSAPTFTCTGGSSQTVYGWYLVGATSGKVLAGQNFDTAITMVSGASLAIDPFKMGLQTLH